MNKNNFDKNKDCKNRNRNNDNYSRIKESSELIIKMNSFSNKANSITRFIYKYLLLCFLILGVSTLVVKSMFTNGTTEEIGSTVIFIFIVIFLSKY